MNEDAQNRLPQGWAASWLGEICEKLVDGSHNLPPGEPSGVPMLSARNISDCEIIFENFRYISTKAFQAEHARTKVGPGDVLLTIVGSIGRSAVVPEGMESFALQRSVAVLKSRVLIPQLCMYQLQSMHVQQELTARSRGTVQKGVYLKSLALLSLRMPPLPEQHRIVAEIEKQFTRLDAAVAALKRVQANLKRYRASVLKAACEGRLVPTEAEVARADGCDYEPADKLLARILKERRARWEADQLAKMHAASKPPKDERWKAKYKEPPAPDTSDLPGLPEGWVWSGLGAVAEVKPDAFSKGLRRRVRTASVSPKRERPMGSD